ncbi:hypothetical protein Glove_166g198 [Diversispora epigaea]|uniref:Uncharacterized protein n=1 Tax=Diversispora epigaea TaxID=1348612 RepID=A0A397IQQ4_9GLOM|nr:hypothetical protein Glove_166g198 [Diversispora epigaea]
MDTQPDPIPAIRIVPHIEGPRSLHFDIIEREVGDSVVIKIGRFTDKAFIPNRVTFKSKVVSRGHAEIWTEGNKFFIRDTKSSSGTFLNHVRLSAPSAESKAFQLKDGDVVQLGVDYQGGTEEIYRCVKMRIELNRSWQRQINPFSINALKQFKQLTGPEAFKHPTSDCCICLSGIGPFQALFLAPCSHVFHYKCIRPLLISHHPGFLCPLCRSFANLDAPIENQVDWEQILAEHEEVEKKGTTNGSNNDQNTENLPGKEVQVSGSQTSLLNSGSTTAVASYSKSQQVEIIQNMNQEIDERPNSSNSSINRSPSTPLNAPFSFAMPIPRSRKMSNSSDDVNDPNIMLSKTLPSSSPPISGTSFFDEIIDSGPSSPANQHQLHREQGESPRLGEITEEDESSVSPSSSNQTPNNPTHFQESGSSSSSTSDNDDDALFLGMRYIDVPSVSGKTEDAKVKGKGVDRFGTGRKEGEDVL